MSQAQFSTDTLTVQHDEEKREFYVLMGKGMSVHIVRAVHV
jgi:hypothetical protein